MPRKKSSKRQWIVVLKKNKKQKTKQPSVGREGRLGNTVFFEQIQDFFESEKG